MDVVSAVGRLGGLPPLWREGRMGLETAALLRSRIFAGHGVPDGDGRGVLLIPGFLAGDGTLALMTRWLRAAGYRTNRAGIRANVDCSEVLCGRIEERLERLAERTGERVTIIGHSRGGVLGKAVAIRRPDLVAGLVTLGAPVTSQLSVHPLVLLHVGVVGALGLARVPGLFTLSCLRGQCCDTFRRALTEPFPPEVRYVSVHTRTDGIVNWRACVDPAADEQVEVRGSHCGLALNPAVYEIVGDALGRFRAADGPATWAQAA